MIVHSQLIERIISSSSFIFKLVINLQLNTAARILCFSIQKQTTVSAASQKIGRPRYKTTKVKGGRWAAAPAVPWLGGGGMGGHTKPHPSVCPSPHSHCNGSTARGGSGGVGSSQLTQNSRRWRRGPSSIPASHLLAGRRTVCNPAEQGQGAITLHGKP